MKNLKQFMGDEEVLAEMKQMLPKLFEPYTARKFFQGLFESFKPSLNWSSFFRNKFLRKTWANLFRSRSTRLVKTLS